MIRRRTSALMFLAGLLLVLLLGGGWLGYSTGGARWLIEQAGDWSGVEIKVEDLNGRLADRLDLHGLSIDLGEIQLTIDRAELDWALWSLLGRELEVERLVVSGMDIVDLLPATEVEAPVGRPAPGTFAPAGAWPLPAWLSGRVDLLQLHDFDYRDADGPVVIAGLIEARLELSNGQLAAETLNYISPYVHLEGAARWDLQTMELDYQAAVSLPEELVDGETLAVAALPVEAAGHLQVTGDWTAYRGTLELENAETNLGGEVIGSLDGVWFSGLQGDWLNGKLDDGRLDLDWSGDFRMDWQARADRLNPEATLIGHAGQLAFLTSGYLAVPDDGPLIIDGELTDLQGLIEGRPLSGHGRVRWAGSDLLIERMLLTSEGLNLEAEGDLAERLTVDLQVADLGHWMGEAGGQLRAQGWLAWDGKRLAGDLVGRCEQLQWQDWQLLEADFAASYSDSETPVRLSVQARELQFAEVHMTEGQLKLDGLLQQHRLDLLTRSKFGDLQLQASGGWNGEAWGGELQQLATRLIAGSELVLQAPVAFHWSKDRWALSPLLLTDVEGESLRVEGHYQGAGEQGDISVAWNKLLLQRLGTFFPNLTLDGESSGELALLLAEGAPERLMVEADAVGSFRHSAWAEPIEKAHLDLDWTDRQLTMSTEASAGTKSRLQLDAEALQPIGFEVPEQGHFNFLVENIRLAGLSPWLPPELELDGRAGLQGEGDWLGEGRFTLVAAASSKGGHVIWHEPQGALQAEVDRVDVDLRWQDQTLAASAKFALGRQGELDVETSLPLPARWPIVFDQNAPLSGRLQGLLKETGVIAAMLPLPVEELTGQLQVDAQVAGSWQKPDLSGLFQLQEAGGYFPQLGISLDPLELNLLLDGSHLLIEKLRLVSGESELLGKGEIRLGKGTVQAFQLQVTGEGFQAVDLPELSLRLSPDLHFEGDIQRLNARGRVEVPLLQLRGVQGTGEVRTSADVVIIQPESEADEVEDFKSDVDIEVVLGDDVRLAASGLNARLTGAAKVRLDERARLLAQGEIRVTEGDFAAYGVKLNIRQGVVRYQNAPVDNPALNILALRDVGRVKAGVQITGTGRRPVVTLYSKPAMPEKDILFTILTGRPITAGEEESSALMLGAGALFAPGESALSAVGLTDVDIQGLFAGDGGLRLRRRLGERWEVESILGNNSGVDLFYVIEFE